MSAPVRLVVEADGGARGNPGPAGWGVVVRDAGSGLVLQELSEAIGVATNNVAEYRGLIAGLRSAAELGAAEVEVRMDSKLVVEQMAGRWKIKHPGLRPLAAQAAELVRRFGHVSWTWVPRERNRDADRLANQAMDAAQQGPGGKRRGPGKVGGPPRAATEQVPEADRPGGWEPPAGAATRLVLVRHGETGLTVQRRYSGRGDVPLSERGRVQAGMVARRLAVLVPRPAAVLTSPLSRCAETAAVVAAGCGGLPVVTETDLTECDFGEWEGRTYEEVRAGWPVEFEAWQCSTGVAPPGGESFQQVAGRVRGVVAHLCVAYPALAVVVVSHVSPLKLMLRDALSAGDAVLHRLFLDPGGISLVDLYPSGAVAVRGVNDTSHLPAAD